MRTQDRPLLRKPIDLFKTYQLRKYYKKDNPRATNKMKWIVFMADGKILHGGLSDRLCGILSMYAYAKKHGYEFKILFISPYNLSEMLLPNTYNWMVELDEISYNPQDAKPVYLSVWSKHNNKVVEYVDSRLKNMDVKQIHVYSNTRYFIKKEVPQLFAELFKPCPMLQNALDKHIGILQDKYVSLTFRFQQLLGDFKEGHFDTLNNADEREKLILSCLEVIKYLYSQVDTEKILVTSDSKTFLERATELPYVYVVSGRVRHMDFTDGEKADISVDMKSYVDMLLIANARQIYLCNIFPLYRSGFPETSSFIQNKPYFEVVNDNNKFYIVSEGYENCY